MRVKNIPNSTATQEGKNHKTLRQLPGWQVVQRYRREGLTQWDIAKKAGVTQPTVAKAIYRRGAGPAVERVWTVLEKILK